MKFATLRDGSLDGRLLVVSRDLRLAVAAPQIATSLLRALQRWDVVSAPLEIVREAVSVKARMDTGLQRGRLPIRHFVRQEFNGRPAARAQGPCSAHSKPCPPIDPPDTR